MTPSDFVDGIVIAVNPIALSVGPASIRWFGIAVALGVAAGLLVALRLGRTRGLTEPDVYALALAAALAGLPGARLLHIADKLDYYIQNPYFLFSPSQVSMASWGALLFGGAAVAIVASRRGIAVPIALDIGVPAFLAGQMIGRLGSLINGESWGAPSRVPWAVTYLSQDAMLPPGRLGIPTHPYAAYEIVWTILALVVAWQIASRMRVDGSLASSAVLLFAVGRVVLGQFREEGVWLWGLQQAQVMGDLVILACVPVVVYLLAAPKQRATSGQVKGAPSGPVL